MLGPDGYPGNIPEYGDLHIGLTSLPGDGRAVEGGVVRNLRGKRPVACRVLPVVHPETIAVDPAWLEKLYASIPPEAIDPASVVELWGKAFNERDAEALKASLQYLIAFCAAKRRK